MEFDIHNHNVYYNNYGAVLPKEPETRNLTALTWMWFIPYRL